MGRRGDLIDVAADGGAVLGEYLALPQEDLDAAAGEVPVLRVLGDRPQRAPLGDTRPQIGQNLRLIQVPHGSQAADPVANATFGRRFGRIVEILQDEVFADLEPGIGWQRKALVLAAEAFLVRLQGLFSFLALGDIHVGASDAQ